ncbi:hypothetical protein APX70_00254 [Pseudomonas syringae pv. maculicola]|uniref:DUF3617 domain-containing protein n=1 Tax=Pseudomonas syringae pv. maculicola TaxID=59511 RepID=A0A3M2WJD1_PSEYM|nr:hypothetical protein APX70_00254 [Pseudomonas syringae pv. maculicola]
MCICNCPIRNLEMNKRMLAWMFCLATPLAQAQMLQPGLWELTSSNMKVDGQQLPDMQLMLGQLQNLPPEQRAMMEQMMKKQGVSLGGKGVRACLTQAQVQSDDIPLTDPASGCTQKITARNGKTWNFQFSCPKAQGTGQAQFLSDREFTTKVVGTFNATGQQQNGSMDTRSVWLGPQCGNVAPRT